MRVRILALAAAGALALAACNGANESVAPPDGPTGASSATPPSDDADPPATQYPTDPPPGIDDNSLPGEPVEAFWAAGDEVDVVGVEHDDVLYVRERPDPAAPVVAELRPLAAGVHTTGRTRAVDGGAVWLELYTSGAIGWSNTRYLTFLGPVSDLTDEVTDPGPQASVNDLTAVVTAQLGPPDSGEITIADGPREGDLISMVADLRLATDESVSGQRLQVFANVQDGEYVLFRVDGAAWCERGAGESGCL